MLAFPADTLIYILRKTYTRSTTAMYKAVKLLHDKHYGAAVPFNPEFLWTKPRPVGSCTNFQLMHDPSAGNDVAWPAALIEQEGSRTSNHA
jgi:hypothetical protein